MTSRISKNCPRKIDNTVLVVDKDHPLDTLPFISDVLTFVATYFGLNPDSPKNARAEVGVGIVIDFLSAAIDDVQDALAEKYIKRDQGSDIKN
ncbi:MAG: hypothetical protein D6B27_06300 [Gammaproteobacteria bacterium]|nr:MAG: hypothetical protein D6B27_06300 [Gammaproteobacteria bacterium]